MRNESGNLPAAPLLGDCDKKHVLYKEAATSPCLTCIATPCCTHLQLLAFQINTVMDIDQIFYLLNFEGVEICVEQTSTWRVYYHRPCRFLNSGNGSCEIHNTSKQPSICVNYNPHNCFYKKAMEGKSRGKEDLLWIDRGRLDVILEHTTFDDDRKIAEFPSWDNLVKILAEQPYLANPMTTPAPDDVVMDEWERLVKQSVLRSYQRQSSLTFSQVNNPCNNCHAYCCKNLVFRQLTPQNATHLDFFKYCLGFPFIQLGITDHQWSLILKTSCKYLNDDRCTVYGTDMRPLTCRYYDEQKCSYIPTFAEPRASGYLRVGLEHFPWLAECFRFDKDGNITSFPAPDSIRSHIEDNWHQALNQPSKLIQFPQPQKVAAPAVAQAAEKFAVAG